MRRAYREQHIEAVIKLYKQEYSTYEIKELLGLKVSTRQIMRWLSELGLTRSVGDAYRIAHSKGRVPHPSKEGKLRRLTIPRKTRMRVLMRDDFKCVLCGIDAKGAVLEVDHKDNDKNNNDMSNLQTLCQDCNYGKAEVFHIDTEGKPMQKV